MSVRASHHRPPHGRPPRVQDLIIQGCYVRRLRDGEIFQVEVPGKHVVAGLKPDQGGEIRWVEHSTLNRDYELVAN